MRRATMAKAGRTAAGSAFTGMARRRGRWRNVARVACLAAAGVLIATHDGQRPAAPPAARHALPLPPLGGVPRLVLPRPRQRRALKGGNSGRGRGVSRINRVIHGQGGKPPSGAGGGRAVRPPPPSPPTGGVGQPAPAERSAPAPPTTGEFTPDPAPAAPVP